MQTHCLQVAFVCYTCRLEVQVTPSRRIAQCTRALQPAKLHKRECCPSRPLHFTQGRSLSLMQSRPIASTAWAATHTSKARSPMPAEVGQQTRHGRVDNQRKLGGWVLRSWLQLSGTRSGLLRAATGASTSSSSTSVSLCPCTTATHRYVGLMHSGHTGTANCYSTAALNSPV